MIRYTAEFSRCTVKIFGAAFSYWTRGGLVPYRISDLCKKLRLSLKPKQYFRESWAIDGVETCVKYTPVNGEGPIGIWVWNSQASEWQARKPE